MRYTFIFIFLSINLSISAQVDQQQTINAIDDLIEFIALPNFGLNKLDIQKNIEWLDSNFQRRGFETKTLETSGNPLFFAELAAGKNAPTILFYMHMDGQAVDKAKWDQADPYQAVIKMKKDNEWVEVPNSSNLKTIDPEWRLFGRATSDDKGPIVAFLHSMDAMIAKGKQPQFNVKVIIDAEEELGSRPLADAVKVHKSILAADALIINDGPIHISGKPTLTFGCRGLKTINFTIYGPGTPQHSGHYGNYAPNPIFRMAKLLSSMKDDDGRVLIDGYYDGIHLDAATKEILANVPDDIQTIHKLLQINEPEKVGQNYQESLQYPSFNARGISSGYVGAQARTIVPDNATVAIDIRLVPESDPDKLVATIRRHIIKEGYHIVDHEPTHEERMEYPKILFLYTQGAMLPFRTDMDAPLGQWLKKLMSEEFKEDPIQVRIMGGTVPIASFVNELNIPAVIVPMVNPDNNQHSPNENLRIGHLQYAMQLFESIMDGKPSF